MSTDHALNPLDRLLRRLARYSSIFGSDVYVSYTHAYVWQANQLCHVFIGLIFALLLLWFSCGSRAAVAVGVGIYAVKELIDYLIAVRLSEGVFPVDRIEVARDCIVDTLFVAGGALIAIAMAPADFRLYCVGHDLTPDRVLAISSVVVVTALFLLMRRLCLEPKRKFDKSGMLWLARLSTFPKNFSSETPVGVTDEIPGFAREDCQFRHLVISGPPRSGRTTLAQSIGGDATAAMRCIRYLTAQRLLEKTRTGFETPSAREQPYQVGEADLVIVDGVAAFHGPGEARSVAAVRKTLDRLVDAGTSTIFQEPLREWPRDGGQPRPLGNTSRDLPQTTWVVDDLDLAEPLRAALEDKFETSVKLVKLEGRLRHRMRLEE